jgi:predicted Zn finger-like uncharacterized protein
MYSQCPECLARFRVTAAALRTAQGTVRCGRCGSAFNALVRLTDTLPEYDEQQAAAGPASLAAPGLAALEADLLPDGQEAATARSGGDPPAVPEFHFTAEDIEQVFVDARDWQRRFGAGSPGADERPAAQEPDAGDIRDAQASVAGATPAAAAAAPVVVHEPQAVEDITLEGERIVIEGVTDYEDEFFDELLQDPAPLPEADDTSQAVTVDLDSTDRFETLKRVPDSAYPTDGDEVVTADRTDQDRALDVDGAAETETAAPVEPVVVALPSPAPVPVPAPAEPAIAAAAAPVPMRPRRAWRDEPAPAVDPLEEFEEESRGSRARLAWTVIALLLTLAFAAQLVHHFRQDLARDVTVGPLVRQAYAWAGRPLAPNWDVGAFELRQWGAETQPDGPGLMTVRASVRNRAAIAQPIPLLRLELDNRFGDTLARRDFEPREYLKDPAQATRLLDPGGSIEAELALVDVPPDAVGYRLDACLRDDQGVLDCAQSPRAANGAAR